MPLVGPDAELWTDNVFRGAVDVVVPVRDGAKTISAALRSVLRQTTLPSRIIVVDDGSKDDTASIVADIGNDLIEFVRTPPVSISHARNIGVKASRAEFVAFLDADDLWHPDKLRRQLRVFTEHENAAVVYCGTVKRRPSGTIRDLVPPSLKGFVLQGLLSGGHAGNSSSIIVKRKALLQIGGYDETIIFGQDVDLLLRLATRYEFHFADEFLVDVSEHPDSITRRRSGNDTLSGGEMYMELLIARISVYEKWCREHKISVRITQAFRKQIAAAAVRRRYGWRWMRQLRTQLQSRSPEMGRKIWSNHAVFAGWITLATLAYPFRLLARRLKVACNRSQRMRPVPLSAEFRDRGQSAAPPHSL
jgi:glycosyltransferase involved in cell wall biosynthesis